MNTFIKRIDEHVDDKFKDSIKNEIKNEFGENKSKYFLNYPTVYIHNKKQKDNKYNVYVGESNDVIQRTGEHYQNRKINGKWQNELLKDGNDLTMYVIANKHFNKSLTLDVENLLIKYLLASNSINVLYNGKGNPQKEYYESEKLEEIFAEIWNELRKKDKQMFLEESQIKDSAVFKASPLHKLTEKQEEIKEFILERIDKVKNSGEDEQLILVEGDAGTGKTVLTSSTFYGIFKLNNEERETNCCIIVNHQEQKIVYEEITKKLGIENKDKSSVVYGPIEFINKHNETNKVDVAFVDEGHLLKTTKTAFFHTGNNQLEEIRKRARIVVLMFDSRQILNQEDYWRIEERASLKTEAISQNNYFLLENQLRICADKATLDWINNFTDKQEIGEMHLDSKGYEIVPFKTPQEMYNAIKAKASSADTSLSRVVATYDWPYSKKKKEDDSLYCVEIDDFKMPWNYQIKAKDKSIEKKSWSEQPQTIKEIGSNFTVQGFDLSYVGVIIGKSVYYENGKVKYNPSECKHALVTKNMEKFNDLSNDFKEEFIKNQLHILLTRGIKGLYIYACDEALRNKLLEVYKNEQSRG